MRLSNRDGFALPMAILMSAVMAAALAASFVATSGEFTTNTATRGQNRAYNLAETGLEQFMVRRNETGWCSNCVANPAVADSEWTRVTLPGGYADVVAVRVRPMVAEMNAMYFIRSRGVDTTKQALSGAGSSNRPEHTVAVYANWTTATINVAAAWVSLSGLNKNGTGVISGVDQCGMKPDVAGVMVDKGDLHVQGNSFNPEGTPPVDTSNTFTSLKSKINIDWAGILGGSISADYTIPGNSFPTAAMFDADTNFWPVIRVKTNGYSLPNRGRGMIIADGDFTISGTNMWSGIVLIGGQLTSNGNNTTSGATLSGLNFLIGGTPSQSSVDDSDANGQKTYRYNSCSVDMAASKLKRYSALPNTWMDNLPAY